MSESAIHNYICFNFYHGWREIDQIYKRKLGNDITPQVTYILQICEVELSVSVNEIASKMKLNKSAVSNLIARMEKKSLVRRIHSLEDRRVVKVELTENGRVLLDTIRENIKQIESDISQMITLEEKETFLRIVSKIAGARST